MYNQPRPVGSFGGPVAMQRRGSRTPPMSPGRGAVSPGRGAMSPADKIRMAAIQQRKQYARTSAEHLLLKWVICWVLFAAAATVFMLWYLFELGKKPVVTDRMSRLLSIHDHISTNRYSKQDRIFHSIVRSITASAIKDQFRDMALKNTGGMDLIRAVAKYWRSLDMDVVKLPMYLILSSRMNSTLDNTVDLIKGDKILYSCSAREPPLIGAKAYIPPAYFAFSPPGVARGPVVYVNYGRLQDLMALKRDGIPLDGSILIARTGKISNAEKVRNAERERANGMVIFLNPVDAAPGEGDSAFPNSMYVDGNAIQRGSVAYVRGDPLTPGLPANSMVHRIRFDDAQLPTIPVQPISYQDAGEIMKQLNERPCPRGWDPELGIPCNIMGESGLSLQIRTYNQYIYRDIYNVIGIIRGKVERDRFVVVGSHTSENTRGSAEPLLSVAKMLVQSKVFARLHKEKKWTPRRSIMFALFFGEEPNFEGSSEWVEDHLATLQNGAVIYITGGLLSGSKFVPKAMPGLSSSLREVAHLVYSNQTTTLLKEWEESSEASTLAVAMPPMGLSDDSAFSFSAGIPTAYLHFMHPYLSENRYPAVGTAYDSFAMVEKMDPTFHWVRMEAQMSALLTRLWADRTVLPFDVLELAEWINWRAKEFNVSYSGVFHGKAKGMEPLLSSSQQFVESAREFMNWTQNVRKGNAMYTRIFNDIVLRISRIFLIPGGIPTRDVTHKNVLFSPEGQAFPGLQDLVRQRPFNGSDFGRHAAHITECIIQANEILHFSPIV